MESSKRLMRAVRGVQIAQLKIERADLWGATDAFAREWLMAIRSRLLEAHDNFTRAASVDDTQACIGYFRALDAVHELTVISKQCDPVGALCARQAADWLLRDVVEPLSGTEPTTGNAA